jgi:hypothetical protein
MRTRAAVAVIILLAISLTGCGKSKKSSSSSGTTTTAAPKAVSTMDITGKEFTFDGPNSVQEGYVKINFTNAGTVDHQAQFLRLQDGKTLQDFAAAGAADPSGLQALALTDGGGGVNAIKPGTEHAVNKLRAGNWLMVCFVPAPDGQPHLAKGMIRPFVVTPPASSETAPTATATVSAKNFAYTLPTFKSGTTTVEFKNTSTDQVHEMTLIKMATGKTVTDAKAFFAKPAGPPPFESAGGAAAVGPGDSLFADVDLTPGTYVALCHVPDPASKKEHLALGMIQQFTVT